VSDRSVGTDPNGLVEEEETRGSMKMIFLCSASDIRRLEEQISHSAYDRRSTSRDTSQISRMKIIRETGRRTSVLSSSRDHSHTWFLSPRVVMHYRLFWSQGIEILAPDLAIPRDRGAIERRRLGKKRDREGNSGRASRKRVQASRRVARELDRRERDDLGHRFHRGGHYFPVMSPRIPDEFGLLPRIARARARVKAPFKRRVIKCALTSRGPGT